MTLTASPPQVTAAPATAPAAARPATVVYRTRVAAVCVALAVLAFMQDPNKLSRDTKLDLYVNPGLFLERALQVWDPDTAFGSLQNQAYGYLFPMGPYYLLTRALGMPEWMAQRFWMALLVVVAFLGMLRLCAALRVGGPVSRIVAALAFALSPRVAATIGPISSEIVPLCVAPWALIPLITGYRRGGARGAASRSALAILCAGGINAVATLAVCVPPAIWLLTRAPGAARRKLAAWWVLAVSLACLWWAIPLLVLGDYSFPFLNYIETSAVTTSSTSLPEVLRGGSHWVAGLVAEGEPWWRGGWITETNSLVVLYSLILAGLGLLGLAWRRTPHRLFLIGCLVAGCVLVGLGYEGPGGSAVGGLVRDLLDGSLAPFRNTHKFDLVVRIPLIIGFCHVLSSARWPLRGWVPRAIGGFAVLVVAAPFLLGQVVPSGSYAGIPGYWTEAADWLSAKGGTQRSLLLPSSSFAEYKWGRPMDEPFHALMRAPWAIRDQIPLGSEGSIRLMDTVEDRIASGEGSPGLARYLARAGVRYVVVRNDLDWARIGAARPAYVHQALDRSGGFRLARSFGCCVAGGFSGAQFTSDYGQDEFRPNVEIYEITGVPTGLVQSYSENDVVTVAGGPESLLAADDRRMLPDSATVLAGDPDGVGSRPWRSLTGDGLRRREVNFGAATGNVSSTLTEQDKFVQPRKAADYLPFPGATTTVAEYTGVSQVTASSSASDADAYLLRGAEYHPGAALDGNPDSAWLSGSRGKAVGQWWQAGFPKPVAVPSITLRLAGPEVVGATPARLRISTSAGSQTVSVADPGAAQTVTIGGPPVSFVRITVTGLAPDSNAAGLVGLREVVIKGVTPERFIRSAYLPTGEEATGPAAIVLDRQAGARRPCADLGKLVACSPYQERLGEEEGTFARRFATAHPGRFSLTVDVTARPGAKVSGEGPQPGAYSTRGSQSPLSEVDRYLAARLLPPGTTLTASSQLTSDPRSGAAALSDGDPATFWIAGPDDKTPSLTVSWPKPRPVSALKLDFPPYPAASLPFAVTVSSAAGTRTAKVDPRGNVKIPALTTNRITLTFPELYHAQTSDPLYGAQTPLPVGLTGISIPGVLTGKPAAKDPPATCGSGPDVTVDGHRVRTRMLTPIREVLAGRRLTALPCSGAQLLGAGMHELIARDAGPWRVQGAALTQGGWASGSSAALDPRPVTVGQWTATSRTLTAGRGGSTVVTVAENFNRGWRARFGGEDLAPIRIDGWRQGWIVPPGESGVITLTYTPQRPYAVGLAVGALGVLLVLLAAWWPSLRLRRASGPLGDPGGFAPLRARPVQGWHLALLGVPVLVLGGPWSLVIAAVCVAAGLGLRAARRSPPWPVVLEGSVAAVSVAMAALAAGALQGWAPWAPGIGLIPQVLGVTAVALTVTALAWELAGERPPADRGDSPVKRGAAGGEPAAVSAAAVEGAGPPEPVTDASS